MIVKETYMGFLENRKMPVFTMAVVAPLGLTVVFRASKAFTALMTITKAMMSNKMPKLKATGNDKKGVGNAYRRIIETNIANKKSKGGKMITPALSGCFSVCFAIA